MILEYALFAAGCFWGIQTTFDAVPGVIATEVGYTGGSLPNPTYEQVCTNATGHAEAIQIAYDPSKVTYPELLDVFFENHDPTTLNKQGPDVGTQYRSAIFYFNEEQKKQALAKIKELEEKHAFSSPIVTQVVQAGPFYPAEEYHQKYLQKKGKKSCFSCLFKGLGYDRQINRLSFRFSRHFHVEFQRYYFQIHGCIFHAFSNFICPMDDCHPLRRAIYVQSHLERAFCSS